MDEDTLHEIPDHDLPLLANLYKNHQAEAPQIYSTINASIIWKKKKPDSNYMTFFRLNNDWLKTGTFVLLMQFSCYDLIIHSLEDDYTTLRDALVKTKKIDWNRRGLWYAISARLTPTVYEILNELKLPSTSIPTKLWVIDREEALKFEIDCPNDVYIGKLDTSHAKLVNIHWPHRSKDSEQYLVTLIEMNNGTGIFLKSDGSLVSWVLKSCLGQMSMLQTLTEHKKKGYAMLVTKIMSKEIAQEGHNPLGTVVVGNTASESMFTKLGFRPIDTCMFTIHDLPLK